jgi:hypothetical protein
MLLRGLHTPARSLPGLAMLVMLSGIVLAIYTYLKKKTILNQALEIYSLLQVSGLNPQIAKFAVAQSAHETGGYTSKVFKENNNCFGMKYAGQYNAKGEKNGHADYETINKSVSDFAIWFVNHRTNNISWPIIINSIETYVKFLKNNNYFTAPEADYLKACKSFYKQIFDE